MSFKEMMLKQKGMWLVTTSDKSKWVIDLDNMMFDNYKWYKAMGTLESELENLDNLLKGNIQIKKIK